MDIEYEINIRYVPLSYIKEKTNPIKIDVFITDYDKRLIRGSYYYPSKRFTIELYKDSHFEFVRASNPYHSKIEYATVETYTIIPSFIRRIQHKSLLNSALFITKNHYQFYRLLQNIPMILHKEQIHPKSIDTYKNKFLKAIKENLSPYEQRQKRNSDL